MVRDIVLISLDTLRADVAYSRKFPGLCRLEDESVVFDQAISSSPLTPVSHATVLTGRQPAGHGVRHLFREQIGPVPILAEVLAAAGWSTGAVVSSPGMNRWYGFDRGFDHYDDWIPPLADGRDALHVVDVELRGTAMKRASMVTERALDWYADATGPRLLFAHYFDAHWPYEAPEVLGGDNPYEEEVAYTDKYLQKLLDGLVERGLDLDESLVVLFSDHGEDLAGWYDDDHAGEERGHPEERGHGSLLFDVTQRVPLIVRAPWALPAGARVSEQVRLVDVAATILELLELPPLPSDGVSLTSRIRGSGPELPAYCETFYRSELAETDERFSDLGPLNAVRHPGAKTIWERGRDTVEVYDLIGDPAERSPVLYIAPDPDEKG